MRLLHSAARTRAVFDDPNLLVARRPGPAGRPRRARRAAGPAGRARPPGGACGANAVMKVACLVAGMAAGADSIDDMDLLRRRRDGDVFGGVRAPSTLGSFLRAFTWGNVRQLE